MPFKATKTKPKKKEIVRKMVETVINEFNDILSSGQGIQEIDSWHEEELRKVYAEIPDNLKDDVYKAYLESISGEDGMDPLIGEKKFMKKLFNK